MSKIQCSDTLAITVAMEFTSPADKEKTFDYLDGCVFIDYDITSLGKNKTDFEFKVDFTPEGIEELLNFRKLLDDLEEGLVT